MEPIWAAVSVVEIETPKMVSSNDFPRRMVPAASVKAWQTTGDEGMGIPEAPFTERAKPAEPEMESVVAFVSWLLMKECKGNGNTGRAVHTGCIKESVECDREGRCR